MSKYDDMRAHYEKRIEELQNDVQFWRDKCFINGWERAKDIHNTETYEKLIDKLLGVRGNTTDELFMFEGKIYKPTDYTFRRTAGQLDELSVDFIRVYPFEKEKSE